MIVTSRDELCIPINRNSESYVLYSDIRAGTDTFTRYM